MIRTGLSFSWRKLTVLCVVLVKNPVGKEWRWVVDNPLMIVQEGVERHQNMIYMFKGVPGLIQDR